MGTFGTFSTISPLANVIVVPIIPLLMAGAFFCAVGGIILAPLGQLMAVPFQLVTDFVLNIVHVLATVPGASISVSWMVLALGSAVVIGWTWKVRGPSHA